MDAFTFLGWLVAGIIAACVAKRILFVAVSISVAVFNAARLNHHLSKVNQTK